jgi:hypothetical protein
MGMSGGGAPVTRVASQACGEAIPGCAMLRLGGQPQGLLLPTQVRGALCLMPRG